YSFDLGHDIAHNRADVSIPRHLAQRRPRQCADGIECDISQKLDPDLIPNTRRDSAAQASLYQRFGNGPTSLGSAAVRLTQRDPVSLRVTDHPGLDNFGTQVNQRTNHAAWVDGGANHAAWVDAGQGKAGEFPGTHLEIPPRNAILRTHDGGVLADQRSQLRGQLGQTVSLHAQDDDISLACICQIAYDARVCLEITLRAENSESVLLHRPQMWTARV